jgi:4-hydroxy-tetrahydrodipicolinate synthase
VAEARGRAPIITGIITDSTTSAIERGKAVRDLGVTALQVTPVHYLFRPDDDAMVRHFDALARDTGLPIVIYNVVPWTYLSPQLLARIIGSVDGSWASSRARET